MQIRLSVSKNWASHSPKERAAFNKWFGKSVVVGPDMKPLRVYHGTGTDIKKFSRKVLGGGLDMFGPGFYFTDSPSAASTYAKFESRKDMDAAAVTRELGSNVMPVYLRITKPVYIDDLSDHGSATKIRALLKGLLPPMFYSRMWQGITGCDADEADEQPEKVAGASLFGLMLQACRVVFELRASVGPIPALKGFNSKILKRYQTITGHDGVIITKTNEAGSGTYYIVFNPDQIKSAVGNSGRYRPVADITD